MVLIVDDDVMLTEVLRRWLELEGYTVDVCGNGQDAFERLTHRSYLCMLLDVNMPKINGIELLLLLQSKGISIPTIVMAGCSDFSTPEMKQFGGVVSFMPKPFAMAAIVKAVRAIGPPDRKEPAQPA
jgi:two-component system OmpR family response regulator